jgi:hypothetical protein
MGKNRVFVLGAGFSKQARMPLATELTRLVLEELELKEHEELQAWLAHFRERVALAEGEGSTPSGFALNIEQMLDFAEFDEELWRMKQQLAPVGRGDGATPWSKANAISTWLGYVQESLAHVIWDAQAKADTGPIERFSNHLAPDDTVVTFNYDTLLEGALSTRAEEALPC